MGDPRLIKGQRPALSQRATEDRLGGRPRLAMGRAMDQRERCMQARYSLQEAVRELSRIDNQIRRYNGSMKIWQRSIRNLDRNYPRYAESLRRDRAQITWHRRRLDTLIQRRASMEARIQGLRQRAREACAENIRRPVPARRA